jgi:hypothetical protein
MGHCQLRQHLCGTEEETSVHILCECEVLASLRHAYLGSFFLDPEDIRVLGMEAIWNFAKGTGLLKPSTEYGAQTACQLRPRCIGPEGARTQYYSILRQHLQQICHYEGDTHCRKCGTSDETSSHITQDCDDLVHRTLQFFVWQLQARKLSWTKWTCK